MVNMFTQYVVTGRRTFRKPRFPIIRLSLSDSPFHDGPYIFIRRQIWKMTISHCSVYGRLSDTLETFYWNQWNYQETVLLDTFS